MLLGLCVIGLEAARSNHVPCTARVYLRYFNAVQRADANMNLLEKLVYTFILAEAGASPVPLRQSGLAPS